MRGVILILSLLASLLLVNIIAYTLSEDYRFFVKKIKYQQEVVENPQVIDDSEQYILTPAENIDEVVVVQSEPVNEDVFFLDVLKNTEKTQEDDFPEMFRTEKEVLERFEEGFIIREVRDEKEFLFGLTDEYPDKYREYANVHFSLYMFPTKSYNEVKNIFEILKYELPYSLNEVNNFGSASFFINMNELYNDNQVRLVFEYENLAFGLKIKKDSYNEAKSILESF